MRARDNPYRAERLHGVEFRLAGTTWEALWTRFRELGGRACVLGPHGTGKTAWLDAFAAWLLDRGLQVRRRTLRRDDDLAEPVFSRPAGSGEVLILDGADLLGPIRWSRVRRRARIAAGLIVTSHGRPLLPVLYRCRSTPSLLEELMRELHPGTGCGQPDPEELHRRHRGNLREALRELYDHHAGLRDGNCRR